MARPLGFDREKAVQTAMQEIWRSGYEANSVKAIAQKLGISRSSFYNTFGTREDLFREALLAYFEQSPDRRLHEDCSGASVKALLTATFREICRVRAADPEGRGCMAINCLCELKGGPHDRIGDLVASAVIGSQARLHELLDMAVERGELGKDTDTRAAALALQTLMVGINAMSKAVRSEADLWLSARATLRGLGLLDESAGTART